MNISVNYNIGDYYESLCSSPMSATRNEPLLNVDMNHKQWDNVKKIDITCKALINEDSVKCLLYKSACTYCKV